MRADTAKKGTSWWGNPPPKGESDEDFQRTTALLTNHRGEICHQPPRTKGWMDGWIRWDGQSVSLLGVVSGFYTHLKVAIDQFIPTRDKRGKKINKQAAGMGWDGMGWDAWMDK